MKVFLQRYKIKIDGYLLALMVIFYCQINDFLPSINDVQRGLLPKRINGKY